MLIRRLAVVFPLLLIFLVGARSDCLSQEGGTPPRLKRQVDEAERAELVKMVSIPGSITFGMEFNAIAFFPDEKKEAQPPADPAQITASIEAQKKRLRNSVEDADVFMAIAGEYLKLKDTQSAIMQYLQAFRFLQEHLAAHADDVASIGKVAELSYILISYFPMNSDEQRQFFLNAMQASLKLAETTDTYENWFRIGVLYFLAHDMPRAKIALEKAFRLKSDAFDPLVFLVILDLLGHVADAGDVEKVLAYFEQPISVHLNANPSYVELAQHVERNPGNVRYACLLRFIQLAYLYLKAGVREDANIFYLRIPLTCYTAEETRLLDEIDASFTAMIAGGRVENAYLYRWLAMVNHLRRDKEKVFTYYRKLYDLTGDTEVFKTMVFTYINALDDYAAAHRLLDEKIARKPEVDDYLYRTYAYWRQERFKQAETAAKKALSLDPGNAQAKHALSVVYFSQKKYGKFEECCREIIERHKDYAGLDRVYLNLAIASLLRKKYPEGGRYLMETLRVNPGEERAKAILQAHYE